MYRFFYRSFFESRFGNDADTGELKSINFLLRVVPCNKSKILMVSSGKFGCGSFREHVSRAIVDFGIRCIVAPSFGETFYNNDFEKGTLLIRLSADVTIEKLISIAEKDRILTVDLVSHRVLVSHFDVEEFRKNCLFNGLDNIRITLQKDSSKVMK